MDDADRAADREEIARKSAMLTSRKPEGPKARGACLYCGERLPHPMRWCNADCRSEWQAEQPR
jgi:hypothetical protein